MDSGIRKSTMGKAVTVIFGVIIGVAVDLLIGLSIGRWLIIDFTGAGIASFLFMIVVCGFLVKYIRYFGIGFTVGVIGTPVVFFLIILGTCFLHPTL